MGVYGSTGLGVASVQPDVVLTNISVAYDQAPFVGNLLFPAIPVDDQGGKYPIFGRENWALPPEGDLRAPGTDANEVGGRRLSTDNYYAEEHALRGAVPDEEPAAVRRTPGINPMSDLTEDLTQSLLLGREIAIRNLATTAANYPADHVVTLSGTTQFNDPLSDPIGVFNTAYRKFRSKIYRMPNLAVIPWEVMTQLEEHPDFIERIKYSQPGILSQDLVAALLKFPGQIVVPEVPWNTANPLQAESIAFMWGKDILLAYVPPAPGPRTPAFGYEFVWRYPGGQTQVALRWREQGRRSEIIEVGRKYDLKLVALDSNAKAIAGYLIKAAVA